MTEHFTRSTVEHCVFRIYKSGRKTHVHSHSRRAAAVKQARELRWVQRNWSKRRSYTYRVEQVRRQR